MRCHRKMLWLGALMCMLFVDDVYANVTQDALRYENDFTNSAGINPNTQQTFGFTNSGGQWTANAQTAALTSDCIFLPQPMGATQTSWEFLDVQVAQTTNVQTHAVEIQDCAGNVLLQFSPSQGCNSEDLTTINPAVNPFIRLVYKVTHSGVPGQAGVQGAQISFWGVHGQATGVAILSVAEQAATVAAGQQAGFALQVAANGAALRTPILTLDLEDINGLADNVNDNGLAEDAQVNYGNGAGLKTWRPLTFQAASSGLSGETPMTPALNATSGQVVWNLNDIPDALSGTMSVDLLVPQGYINTKTLAARAKLSVKDTSICMMGGMSEIEQQKDSGPVTVSSTYTSNLLHYTGTPNPVVTNATVNFSMRFQASTLPTAQSDVEDITWTLTSSGTCQPQFVSATFSNLQNARVISGHTNGQILSNAVPIVIKADRFNGDTQSHPIYINYKVPASCANASVITIDAVANTALPTLSRTSTHTRTVTTSQILCRGGYSHAHRSQIGDDTNNYNRAGGFPEYYINNGSIRTGEYYSAWIPYGNASYRRHSTPLDQSYYLFNVPKGASFHGVVEQSYATRLYKDCSNTAPIPTAATFVHDATQAPHPTWKPVSLSWNGPFTAAPNENDPIAIVPEQCRVLLIKDLDNPVSIGPDFGNLVPRAIFKVCDGSNGCAEIADGERIGPNTGQIYTHKQGTVSTCSATSGYSMLKESKSWSKVYLDAGATVTPAGEQTTILLNPENRNMASVSPQTRWAVNLFDVRDLVDLNTIIGDVVGTGSQTPPNGDIANIVFTAPDATACAAAADATSSACLAWWDVPQDTQPPNLWGKREASIATKDSYKQLYRLRMRVNIKPTTNSGTILTFQGEARSLDLSTIGPNNAVNVARWSADNYIDTVDVEVGAADAISATKKGPATWPLGQLMSYTMTLKNDGNAPNKGVYFVDQVPRQGVNGSEFTPAFNKFYTSFAASDIIVETSSDATCYATPFAGSITWNPIAMVISNRAGYTTESGSDLSANTHCIRVRLSASGVLNPNQVLRTAFDVTMPSDAINQNKKINTKLTAGALQVLGSTTDVAPVETVNVTTIIRSEVSMGIEKSVEADTTQVGRAIWTLRVFNKSGLNANGITVVDDLPGTVKFDAVQMPLPNGVSCVVANCPVENADAQGNGGRVRLRIAALTSDDGSPNSGTDEVAITLTSTLPSSTMAGASIQNCAQVTPDAGIGESDCATVELEDFSVNKDVTALANRANGDIYPGDLVRYTLSIQNNSAKTLFARIHDALPGTLSFVPGTLKIDGASASNALFTGRTLSFTSPTALAPNETIDVVFDAEIAMSASAGTVSNTVVSTPCVDASSTASCSLSQGDAVDFTLTLPIGPNLTITAPTDGTTSSNAQPGVTGTAKPNTTIDVIIDGNSVGTTRTDAAGQWTFALPNALADGAHTIVARSVDGAQPDTAPVNYTVDTIGPAVTLITPTNGAVTGDNTPNVSGTVEVGATVEAIIKDAQGTVVATLTPTVDANGDWNIDSTQLPDGDFTIEVTGRDPVGNTTTLAPGSFTVDTTGPAVTLDTPTQGMWTNDNTPTISGTTEVGASVEAVITDDQGMVVATLTPTVDVNGDWSIDTAQLPDGNYTVDVSAKDPVGNTTTIPAVTFAVDTVDPVVSVTNPADGSFTANPRPTLSGTSEPGSTLVIELKDANGAVVHTANVTADVATGAWSVADIAADLADGAYTINATATDLAGNTGNTTSSFTVDSTALPLTVTQPTAGQSLNDNTPDVIGTTAANTTVTITVSDAQGNVVETLTTTSDANGDWNATLSMLADGPFDIEVAVSNQAGVTSTQNVDVTIDTLDPTLTVDAPVDGEATADNTPTISGTTDPGVDVTVVIKDDQNNIVETLTVAADAMGAWSIDPMALPDGSYTIEATATDAAGNTTTAAPVGISVDTTPPALDVTAPTENELLATRTVDVTGTSEPAATITVEFLNENGVVVDTQTVTTDANGDWTVASMMLANGTYKARVTAQDAVGNEAMIERNFSVDAEEPLLQINAPAQGESTQDTTPTIAGVADADAVVTILIKDDQGNVIETLTPTVDMNGMWTIDPTQPLAEGAYTIEVTATRPNGKMTTIPVNVTIDTTAPTTTILTPADGMVGNMNQPEISGTSEPGATVDVKVINMAGTIVFEGQVIADDMGNWSITPDAPLADDQYTITATGLDAAGNQGQPTMSSFTIDTNAPLVTIVSPTNGSSDNDDTPTISGTAEPGQTITIWIDGMQVGEAVADDMGAWSFDVPDDNALAVGDHTIEATTKDAAGNEGTSGELTITINTPKAPVVITSPTEGAEATGPSVVVTGTGEPGDMVEVTIGDQTVTVTVGDDGMWTATVDNVPEGATTVTAKSNGQEVTVGVTVTHKDAQAYILQGAGCSSTHSSPTSSLWLLGLLGLLGLRRRRRRA